MAARARAVRIVWPGVVLAVALGLSVAASAAPVAPHPLETAIVDPDVFTGPNASVGLARAVSAGARAIKIPLFWNEVAPARRPRGFEPADPSDPAYTWGQLDTQIRQVRRHGLTPIVYIAGAPAWAMHHIDGALRPDPGDYRAFALASVRRYSGHLAGLPRVGIWQAWNEPNKVPAPRFKQGTATWYRTLVNAFAASVHSEPGDEVVAGGLAPFGISTAIAPLKFMRSLLCVSPGPSPHATCHAPLHFDIWSTDPYTAGGPTHLASQPGDVSIAELPEMKAVLDAGVRLGNVATARPSFWVTEFSWDSDPPDPGGVPAALEGRWVAEALYDMWSSGVSLVTWFTLRDQPLATSVYQAGLYYAGATFAEDRPKPAFTAFRFPFVAFPIGKQVSVWGRTPAGRAGTVRVEQHGPLGWAEVGRLATDRFGIFSATLNASGHGPLRALFPVDGATSTSLPFSLVNPPDHTYQPFGSPVPATSAGSSSLNSAVSQYVELAPTAGGGSAVGAAHPSAPVGAPGSALAAAASAVATAGGRAAAFAAGLAAVTLLLLSASLARRRANRRP